MFIYVRIFPIQLQDAIPTSLSRHFGQLRLGAIKAYVFPYGVPTDGSSKYRSTTLSLINCRAAFFDLLLSSLILNLQIEL